jgi:hypothetical protein
LELGDNARMKLHRPFHSTQHRRQRLVLWALALLSWMGAVLAGKDASLRQLRQRAERISLDGLTATVVDLMLVRAFELARLRPRKLRFWRYGRDLRPRHLTRSLLGSRLHRVLKPKDPAMRMANLIAVLRDFDFYAGQLALRMKRRLTRLWPILPAPEPAEPLITLASPAPTFSDSS